MQVRPKPKKAPFFSTYHLQFKHGTLPNPHTQKRKETIFNNTTQIKNHSATKKTKTRQIEGYLWSPGGQWWTCAAPQADRRWWRRRKSGVGGPPSAHQSSPSRTQRSPPPLILLLLHLHNHRLSSNTAPSTSCPNTKNCHFRLLGASPATLLRWSSSSSMVWSCFQRTMDRGARQGVGGGWSKIENSKEVLLVLYSNSVKLDFG